MPIHKKSLQKIHALDTLLESCIVVDYSLEVLKDDIIFLADYYITTRYPANIPDANWIDAEHALKSAQSVQNTITKKLLP